MNPEDRADAIFGAVDGLTSCLGVVAGAVIAGARPSVFAATTLGLAVAAAISMAGGDYLANTNHRRAAVMGAATFGGSVAPAAPFFVLAHHHRLAVLGTLIIAGLIGVGVGRLRRRATTFWGSYGITFAILIAATLASILVTIAFGAGG